MGVSFKRVGLGIAAGVLALAGASAANAVEINTYPVGSPNFIVTLVEPETEAPLTPDSNPSFVAAMFFATYSPTSAEALNGFQDSFTFTLPVHGLGGGSLSLSVADLANPTMTITSVIINNTAYNVASTFTGPALLTLSNIPISAGDLNTITVVGSGYGTYNGNISFLAGAVPEPEAWAMMIAGFGLVGLAMRQRRTSACAA